MDLANERDADGNTPLMYAAGNKEDGRNMMKLLIKNGADINLKNNNGKDLLQVCVWLNYIRFAEFALENGANPNSQNIEGNTSLHMATKSTPEMVKLLLDNGAKRFITNKRGKTPLDELFYSSASSLSVNFKEEDVEKYLGAREIKIYMMLSDK
jgi:ankyrin repeat protein